MKRRWIAVSLSSLLAVAPLAAKIDREKVLKAVDRIAKQQKEMQDELQELKRLLGVSEALDGLELLQAKAGASERVRLRIEDGTKAYERDDYEQAKEDFQRAWEEDPSNDVTNFNLGMAYHKLGNTALAKRMLKSALEANKKIAGAKEIQAFLDGRTEETEEPTSELTAEEKEWQTTLTNLKKEVDSYLRAKELPLPRRRSAAAHALREMQGIGSRSPKMMKEFYMDVGDAFAEIELHTAALQSYKDYEKSMEGEVLPDGYHAKVLELEQRRDDLNSLLDRYIDNEPPRDIRRKLERDLDELAIFATQMNEFVEQTDREDEDFQKICQRLKEYHWGNHADRHVMVVNRYEELLYSSLPGTLSLDRYQDRNGMRFFQNIVRLADRLELKSKEFKEVELAVKGSYVPYVILYTYVPKHEAFIIVRLPRRDLS